MPKYYWINIYDMSVNSIVGPYDSFEDLCANLPSVLRDYSFAYDPHDKTFDEADQIGAIMIDDNAIPTGIPLEAYKDIWSAAIDDYTFEKEQELVEDGDLCDFCMFSGKEISHVIDGKTICYECVKDMEKEENA